jgi:hypothetical protein
MLLLQVITKCSKWQIDNVKCVILLAYLSCNWLEGFTVNTGKAIKKLEKWLFSDNHP